MNLSVSPSAAWEALPAEAWDANAARHLLQRIGWTARSEEIERATKEGLNATLERAFPSTPPSFPKPRLVERFEQTAAALQREIPKLSGEEKIRAQRELQERGRLALQE